ncbi:hypothetical protein [Bacillus sp. NEAU-Y102]
MGKRKRIAIMWLAEDMLYHSSDEVRAKAHKEDAKPVWVGLDVDYFIGTVQHVDVAEGLIFDSVKEAEERVNAYNEKLMV